MRYHVTRNKRIGSIAEPLVFGAIFVTASSAAPAWAYLDPGTGSMMLQLMLGGVAGAIVVGKLYMHRASEFFRSFGRRRPAK
jgi:hypothetical protein